MTPSRSRRRRTRKKKSNTKKIIAIIFLLVVAMVIIVGYIMLNDNQEENNLPIQMKVLFKTSMGNMTIQLRDDMPITTGNFKNLVQEGVYEGTIFHRVISDFMIQGGDHTTGSWSGGAISTIKDEFTNTNENNKGTIAMANAGPNTGSSQFFINVVDNNYLDDAHPVFGEVIDGTDIADAISNVDTDGDPPNGTNHPLEDVILIKATLID